MGSLCAYMLARYRQCAHIANVHGGTDRTLKNLVTIGCQSNHLVDDNRNYKFEAYFDVLYVFV